MTAMVIRCEGSCCLSTWILPLRCSHQARIGPFAMKMPEPDSEVLARHARIVAALRAIVPGEGVIDTEKQMRAYESDGLTAYRQLPMVVVLPDTVAQVSAVLRY